VVSGTGEIHTATFPRRSYKKTPFVVTDCELTGADAPAQSPLDCADPSTFEIVLNAKAFLPTTTNKLKDPDTFLNSGLLIIPLAHKFVASRPGRYTFVCLVHGPQMSGVIKVS
jgi:hypothetical protein